MNKFLTPENPFKNPEEEAAYLRRLIAEKEKALQEIGLKKEDLKPTREVLAQYKTAPPSSVLHPEFRINEEFAEAIALKLEPEEHDAKISELVKLAQKEGIKNALAVVEKMRNFHITDDFHRFVSEYLREGFTIPGLNPKEKLGKSLGMVLYEVLIPEDSVNNREGEVPNLAQVISSMEQFYAGMFSVSGSSRGEENWISLEIANANFSQEVVFYVAVPVSKKNLFEKHILSVFHNAKISEKPDDYNIFNETGVTMGAHASLAKSSIFPLKTYEAFNHDPLNAILSSFSKVNRDGEGAAIQLIWSPAGEDYIKKYKTALEKIKKGVPLKEAANINEGIASEFTSTFKNMFSSSKPKEEEKKEPIDESAIEEINKKISAPIVRCNLRLLTSSNSEAEAREILESLKSGFNQFDNTLGNSIKWQKAEKGALRSLAKNFSFRIFDKDSAIPLNLHEVTSMMHFHTKTLSAHEGLRQSRSASAPAPLDTPKEGLLIGTNRHRNTATEIKMSDNDRLRHFYCIGQTGTGKTTLLKEMIIQDMKAGHGVCMIDPHGSDIQDVLSNVPPERFDDVIYFDPAYTARPSALNMLEFDERFPEQKTFVVNELFGIFKKLYGAIPESMGPAFEQYFRNSALLVMDDPASGNTLVDVSRALSDRAYRDMKISKCKNPLIKQFWINAEKTTGEQGLANYVQYVTNKFDVFLTNEIMRPVVAQEKSSWNFRDIMDNKKILLVNLSKGRLEDINANLIGLILVGKILMAALSRADSFGKDLPPFYLYLDEFQSITTDSISTILSEARKYKLSLAIAHQFIAQLEEGIKDSVFGNVGSICAFRVGAADAEVLEKQFSPVFSASDLMGIDNYNAYLRLLVGGKPARPFNVEIPPPPQGSAEQIEKLKEMSYQKYGKPREEVEAEILAKFKV